MVPGRKEFGFLVLLLGVNPVSSLFAADPASPDTKAIFSTPIQNPHGPTPDTVGDLLPQLQQGSEAMGPGAKTRWTLTSDGGILLSTSRGVATAKKSSETPETTKNLPGEKPGATPITPSLHSPPPTPSLFSLSDSALRGPLTSEVKALLFLPESAPYSLRPKGEVKTTHGRHQRFEPLYRGFPVHGGYYNFHRSKKGGIRAVQFKPLAAVASLAPVDPPTFSPEKVVAFFRFHCPDAPIGRVQIFQSEPVFFPQADGNQLPAFRFHAAVAGTPHEYEMVIDGEGALLDKTPRVRFFKPQPRREGGDLLLPEGLIFNPNPVVTLENNGFTDNDDADGPLFAKAYQKVALRGLDGSGLLRGQFVDTTLREGSARSDNGRFFFNRSQPGFEDVMVYYHIDRAQRYIQELGILNANNQPQMVSSHGTDDDNSWFSPGTGQIFFGTGGVDDAEDAEIIVHEYTHSIQESIIPGFGKSHEAASMGEGFADYMAASLNSDSSFQNDYVGDWDGTAYSQTTPPCLRDLLSTHRYPQDLAYEIYADGSLWASILWSIRKKMEGKVADRLFLEAHFYMSPSATFLDSLKAILQADRELFQGRYGALVTTEFAARGLTLEPENQQLATLNRFRALHR